LRSWGESSIRLVRKPPFEFGKRLLGLVLSAAIIGIFMRPAILWVLHPVASEISGGRSPLPQGMARWDLLGLTIFVLVCGFLLLTRPEKSVEILFSADKTKLQDKTTLRLWTLYVQGSAIFLMVWSLLPATDFIRSIRS
jgi:hypothetical protein